MFILLTNWHRLENLSSNSQSMGYSLRPRRQSPERDNYVETHLGDYPKGIYPVVALSADPHRLDRGSGNRIDPVCCSNSHGCETHPDGCSRSKSEHRQPILPDGLHRLKLLRYCYGGS